MLPIVQLDNKGLYTYSNQLSQVPPGAMTIANNIVIDKPGVAETRRGFEFYGTTLPSYALKGFVFNSRLIYYCNGGQLAYDSNGTGTWVTYSGSYFPPTASFINSTQANGNFYFTTNNGVYKLDSLTGTPRAAGGPQALDLNVAVSGAGTAVPNNTQAGYSVVWGYTDANNNLILGAPSQSAVLINTAGSTQNVTITATIPQEVTTSYFVQVYRTPSTSGAAVVPGNNYQLAIQYTPTAGDITAKSVTIADAVPDSLLGAYLYTADGQPSNYPNTPPPLCLDVATYNSMTFYINFQTLQQANITMTGTGAPNGIQNGDTLTITDQTSTTAFTYTGAAANNFALHQFQVVVAGSIAANIDATARNLVACINQDTTNTYFYAYYQTGTNVLPGAIILKARNLQQLKFYINTSRTTCWTPTIPTAGITYISGNSSSPSSFMVSKVSQPDAVPVVYTIPVQTGNISVVLYRGLALQDALYLFTNAGVFRVTGTDPSTLQVLLFDSSALLVGLQTPQILNNSIYYYSTQGICNVSSGGNQIVSRNVERDVLQLSTLTNFSSLAYGCAYESDRKYDLWTPTIGSDTLATQTYVYNWILQAFTLWNKSATSAIVNQSTQRLYITDQSGNVFQERKALSNADFADESYAITISSINTVAKTMVLVSSANVTIGDIIQQTVSGVQYSLQVTGNNIATNTITVSRTTGFTTAAATNYKSIVTIIKYAPITCGYAQYMKRILSWSFGFSNANFSSLTVNMSTDIYPQQEMFTISPTTAGGWGTEPLGFGTQPWGLSTIPEQMIPAGPTRNTAICQWVIVQLSLTQAFTSLSLDGIALTFDIIGTRSR